MSVTTPDRVLKQFNPLLGTYTYLRMCRTPDQKRVVGAWWLYEEVNNRFPLDKGWEPPDTPSPPLYEIRSAQGKGRGLFATRDIKRNDVILRERPILLAPGRSLDIRREYEFPTKDKNLLQLLYWLEQGDREQVVQLHNCKTDRGPIDGILETNAIRASFPGSLISDEYGALCMIISCANHDCSPNSDWDFNQETVIMTLFATRDISAGEEITVTYANPYMPTKDRRKELKLRYDFTCTCTPCSSPNPAESDQRRRFIETTNRNAEEIWKYIYEIPSAEKMKRNIEVLERVHRMMDEEDIHESRSIHVKTLDLLYGAFGDLDNFKKWGAEAAKIEAQMNIVSGSDESLWQPWFENPFSLPVWAVFRLL